MNDRLLFTCIFPSVSNMKCITDCTVQYSTIQDTRILVNTLYLYDLCKNVRTIHSGMQVYNYVHALPELTL